jgi:hypothetical protein
MLEKKMTDLVSEPIGETLCFCQTQTHRTLAVHPSTGRI